MGGSRTVACSRPKWPGRLSVRMAPQNGVCTVLGQRREPLHELTRIRVTTSSYLAQMNQLRCSALRTRITQVAVGRRWPSVAVGGRRVFASARVSKGSGVGFGGGRVRRRFGTREGYAAHGTAILTRNKLSNLYHRTVPVQHTSQ